jgi:hypothetical protein
MFYVNGTLQTRLNLIELSIQLARQGISVESRESHHYSSGQYLRLRHDDVWMTLERTGSNEYLVRADSEQYPALLAMCNELSRHLSAAEMAHKIEVYDEDDKLLNQYTAP